MPDTSTPAPNDWRLDFCPQCDYSLHGLPEQGVCPECGQRYDQQFIVLRGRPLRNGRPDEFQGALKPTQIAWMVCSVSFYLFIGHLRDPLSVMLVAMFLAPFAIAVLARLSSVRPGEALVWLGPAGIGQQSPVDRHSIAGWARLVVAYCSLPLLLTWLVIEEGKLAVIPAAVVSVIVAGVVGLSWMKRPFGPRQIQWLPSADGRPILYDWRSFELVTLSQIKGDRYRLLANLKAWLRLRTAVDIELHGPPERMERLRAMIAQWRRSAASLGPISTRPSFSISRALGTALRRLTGLVGLSRVLK